MSCLAQQAAHCQDAAADQHWKNRSGRTPHIVSRVVYTSAAVAFPQVFAQVVLIAHNEPGVLNRPDAIRPQIHCGKCRVAISPIMHFLAHYVASQHSLRCRTFLPLPEC